MNKSPKKNSGIIYSFILLLQSLFWQDLTGSLMVEAVSQSKMLVIQNLLRN